ncbi:Tas retrotransposon peptidase A16, partial [Ostertagia ostertagi]
RLNSITEWLKANENLLTPPLETEKPKRLRDVRVALKVCEESIGTVESSLQKLAEAFENLEERSADDDAQYDKYVESANDVIVKLDNFKTLLWGIWEDCMETANTNQNLVLQATAPSPLSISKLPEIPIPNFSGKRWEWDNYWTLFLANVHQQELTDLQKFNYLLSSLSGEARQSISRFQVSAANYHKAIDHLKKRYGHKDGIVLELHRNLNLCAARGPRTEDQRQLFEKLSSIATQLKDHGEHLDNYLAVHTFLQKFHGRIQKAATKRCMRHELPLPQEESYPTQTEGELDWTLDIWLSVIDNIISEEERLQELLPREKEREAPRVQQSRGSYAVTCEYCKLKGHKWNTCPKIPTPSSRKAFLLESNRCLNCGSNTHRVASCTGGNCRQCHGKHHTAICSKSVGLAAHKDFKRDSPQMVQQQPSKPTVAQSSKNKFSKPSKQHVVTIESDSPKQDENEAVVMQMNQQPRSVHNKVILLVGSANILDSMGTVREATVLLDTGSELSFITADFAKELGLPVVESVSLMISTFGSQNPSEKTCDVITLHVRDIEGGQHELRLLRTEYITGAIEQANLDQGDLEFIDRHGIVLSQQGKSTAVKPQILLGCDYLWDFMLPVGKLILPSGLQLIPTKFGYIVTGQRPQKTVASAISLTIQNPEMEKDTWDRYWSLESENDIFHVHEDLPQSTQDKTPPFVVRNRYSSCHLFHTIKRMPGGRYFRLSDSIMSTF